MKSFVLALAVVAIVAVGASVVLKSGFEKPVEQAYVTQGVRL